ncbi:MAG: radical SAM protein [Nitrospinae bacterium]|nr:radical SAM protein [Nitrospinota bacterium]MBI3813146.1 radical SAM protein [Nitrospinota bacterium]
MRGTYYKLILNQLRKGNFFWFPAQIWKYLTIPISQRLGRPLSGPINGSLFVTYRCNSDCVMCDYPQRAGRIKGEGFEEFDTNRMIEIIHDFAELGTTGLGFTGGEALLRKDIFTLLKTSIESGMITNINTNGYLIDEGTAKELMSIGLDSINISFDGATDETFEKLRGAKNGLKKAIKAIENLKKFKDNKGSPMINAVTVISSKNADEIDEIIKLLKGLGADHLGFMPVHDFSFKKDDEGVFHAEQEKMKKIVDSLLTNWDKQFFDNSTGYINLFKTCFEGKKNPITCYVGYSHIMADCYGRVFPCWPWIEKDRAIGDIKNGVRLRDLWYSDKLKGARKELSKCHECFWNCHTELNLLFNRYRGRP